MSYTICENCNKTLKKFYVTGLYIDGGNGNSISVDSDMTPKTSQITNPYGTYIFCGSYLNVNFKSETFF